MRTLGELTIRVLFIWWVWRVLRGIWHVFSQVYLGLIYARALENWR